MKLNKYQGLICRYVLAVLRKGLFTFQFLRQLRADSEIDAFQRAVKVFTMVFCRRCRRHRPPCLKFLIVCEDATTHKSGNYFDVICRFQSPLFCCIKIAHLDGAYTSKEKLSYENCRAFLFVPEEVLLDWLRVGFSFILVFFIGQLYLRYLSGGSLRF